MVGSLVTDTARTFAPPQFPVRGWPGADVRPTSGILTSRHCPTNRPSRTGAIAAMATIIYTHTDEAPLLATYSFLPIIAGVRRQGRRRGRDPRHLAGRPDHRPVPRPCSPTSSASTTRSPSSASWPRQPEANIIKLPNISASIPQLKAAITELQEQGYDLPDYPENPQTDEDKRHPRALRQGQGLARSTRCCARATPTAARRPRSRTTRRAHPHRMGAWSRRLEDQRRHDGQGRLPLQREVGGHRRRRHPAHRARRPPTAP